MSACRARTRRHPGSNAEHDRRLHLFAELLVRNAEHRNIRALAHARTAVLGLLRIDVHTAGVDHVVAPVGEIEIAFLIDVPDIAERRPAFVVVSAGRLLPIVVIRIDRPLAKNTIPIWSGGSSVACPRRRMCNSATRSPAYRTFVPHHSAGVIAHMPIALRAAVVLVNDRAPPCEHLFLHIDRTRCGGVNREPDECRAIAITALPEVSTCG